MGIRFGCLTVNHMHCPIIGSTIKLNEDKSGCCKHCDSIGAKKENKDTNTLNSSVLGLLP